LTPTPGEAWLQQKRDGAVRALRSAISATGLERARRGFGWTVRPAPGSVLASPHFGAWDPEPDYFHHWIRDAAVAMRVLPEVLTMVAEGERGWWMQAFRDHVAFSLAISDPDRRGPERNQLAGGTRDDHRQFLRPDTELAALTGAAWLEEPRFAPDGGPDLERWSRPQDDGPALRASACLRVAAAVPQLRSPEVDGLVARDLSHIARVAGRPCIGPWEEEPARRTGFTLIAQWDALDRGAKDGAQALQTAAARVSQLIAQTADPAEPAWRESVEAPPGRQDSATVLAILHADRREGPLALDAPRTLGTVAALERRFEALYPINRGRAVPAMGRWDGDAFFGGNPWFPVTLGCAELHYRIAAMGRRGAWEKAEAWMALVEEVAPGGDALPEQFDRMTGAPVSCPALTWSAAAFIGAAAARDEARQAMASR
jgi:glucoamylase